jgi:hypothetical protein
MKIAKLNTTPIQITSQDILANYYVVKDNHVFVNEDDVTSVDNLFVFNQNGNFDYQIFRDSLATNMIPQWANMLFADRKKCVQHYKYPANLDPNEWGSYFSTSDHERNWNILTAKTRATRLQRLFAAFQKISYALTETQVALVYMTTKNYLIDYYYANLPHIFFWVQNGVYPPLGINFTTNGFQQMSGFSPQLEGQILDILVNGNYDASIEHESIIIY